MDRAGLIRDLHEIAAGMTKGEHRPAPQEGDASLVDQYGFSSLDALEYLLILEEKFDVVFEDEDLTEETLFSIEGLATYILQQKVGESRTLT
ncbi:acyl carrier protein [Streptomyces sp. V2]|nr:acyl carrier protein [Streptomyces niveiscabiei]MDX3387380.1 acyl carrier protein [Streptomyces niveiscabiei]PWG14283.1 acyl carrier protein [Streptomyces sp. V2]